MFVNGFEISFSFFFLGLNKYSDWFCLLLNNLYSIIIIIIISFFGK